MFHVKHIIYPKTGYFRLFLVLFMKHLNWFHGKQGTDSMGWCVHAHTLGVPSSTKSLALECTIRV